VPGARAAYRAVLSQPPLRPWNDLVDVKALDPHLGKSLDGDLDRLLVITAVMTVAEPFVAGRELPLPACSFIPYSDTTRGHDGSVVPLAVPDFDPHLPLPLPEPEPEPEPEPAPYTSVAANNDCQHLGLPGKWYACVDLSGAMLSCVPRPAVDLMDGVCGAVGMVKLEPCGW
jgi:hypothetical protein